MLRAIDKSYHPGFALHLPDFINALVWLFLSIDVQVNAANN